MRLVADDGSDVEVSDDETIGEVAVRGPNVFSGYLNRPDATAEAIRDGWFFTGDIGTRAPDGYWRIVGRRSTDLIKTGGYKVGAGEIEVALLEHPAVREAAVTAAPDDDLGERIVAWVVAEARAAGERELIDHVAAELAPHKRPREVRFLDELPRNAMGKVVKAPAARNGRCLTPAVALLAVRVDDVLDLVGDAAGGVLDLAGPAVDLALVLEALVVGEARRRPPWCGPSDRPSSRPTSAVPPARGSVRS